MVHIHHPPVSPHLHRVCQYIRWPGGFLAPLVQAGAAASGHLGKHLRFNSHCSHSVEILMQLHILELETSSLVV